MGRPRKGTSAPGQSLEERQKEMRERFKRERVEMPSHLSTKRLRLNRLVRIQGFMEASDADFAAMLAIPVADYTRMRQGLNDIPLGLIRHAELLWHAQYKKNDSKRGLRKYYAKKAENMMAALDPEIKKRIILKLSEEIPAKDVAASEGVRLELVETIEKSLQ